MLDLDMFERNQIDELRVSGLLQRLIDTWVVVARVANHDALQTPQPSCSLWVVCKRYEIVHRHAVPRSRYDACSGENC